MASGGVWKGEYYVANLSDLRRGKRKPRVQRIRSLVVDDTKGHVYPMRALYDFVSRSAMFKRNQISDSSADDSKDDAPLFDYNAATTGDTSPGGYAAEARAIDDEASCIDYWEIDEEQGRYVYHHVMSRKRLFVPHKSEDAPALSKLANVRVTGNLHKQQTRVYCC